MIDWVTMRLPGSFPNVGKLLRVLQPAGYETRTFTSEKSNLYTVGAEYTLQQGRSQTHEYLELKFCPPKILQGHNGLGSNDLRGLVKHVIPTIFEDRGLTLTKELKQTLRNADYELQEVHVTELLSMPHELIPALCAGIRRHAPDSLQATPLEKGIGVRLWPHSRDRKVLIYDKVQYFKDKPEKHLNLLLAGVARQSMTSIGMAWDFEKLKSYLGQGVRVECKLLGPYLRRNGLTKGSAWTRRVAREHYLAVLQAIPLEDIPFIDVIDGAISTAPMHLKPALALWKHRCDVGQFYTRSSFLRHCQDLKNLYGFDVARPFMPLPHPLDWTELISARNIVRPPEWANESLFRFRPSNPVHLHRDKRNVLTRTDK